MQIEASQNPRIRQPVLTKLPKLSAITLDRLLNISLSSENAIKEARIITQHFQHYTNLQLNEMWRMLNEIRQIDGEIEEKYFLFKA